MLVSLKYSKYNIDIIISRIAFGVIVFKLNEGLVVKSDKIQVFPFQCAILQTEIYSIHREGEIVLLAGKAFLLNHTSSTIMVNG